MDNGRCKKCDIVLINDGERDRSLCCDCKYLETITPVTLTLDREFVDKAQHALWLLLRRQKRKPLVLIELETALLTALGC